MRCECGPGEFFTEEKTNSSSEMWSVCDLFLLRIGMLENLKKKSLKSARDRTMEDACGGCARIRRHATED
jgi:hypothetical protein